MLTCLRQSQQLDSVLVELPLQKEGGKKSGVIEREEGEGADELAAFIPQLVVWCSQHLGRRGSGWSSGDVSTEDGLSDYELHLFCCLIYFIQWKKRMKKWWWSAVELMNNGLTLWALHCVSVSAHPSQCFSHWSIISANIVSCINQKLKLLIKASTPP